MTYRRFFFLTSACVLAAGFSAAEFAFAAPPPGAPPSTAPTADDSDPGRADDIRAAIQRAQQYLLAHLPEMQKNKPELSALAIHALIRSNRYRDKELDAAARPFFAADMQDATTLSLRLRTRDYRLPDESNQHWQADMLKRAEPDAAALIAMEMRDGLDLAVSGDVARAMAFAQQLGVDVPDTYWKHVDAVWRKSQHPDGSWSVGETDSPAVRARITAKGTSTMLLARTALLDANGCKPLPPDPSLDSALNWLDHHVDDALSDPEALAALGDLGVISGRRRFGSINWYARGTTDVLKQQNADGSWPADPKLTGADPEAKLVPETVYAIQFLRTGDRAVAILKLDQLSGANGAISPIEDRPADVARFTDWAGPVGFCSAEVGWERVNARMPARNLSDAGVLYVSGSEPLAFTEQERQTLRAFVQHGGLIFGNADCGSSHFADSFVALGEDLFPDYSFRELPPDHVMFASGPYKETKWHHWAKVKVMALGNGVREFMLIAPDLDFGKAWVRGAPGPYKEPFEIGVDLLVYANGKNFLGDIRGQPSWPLRNETIDSARTIRVARLHYPGNADPEPGGWERLAIVMHNDARTDLDVTAVQLGTGKLTARDFRVAHLTGTEKLSLTDAQRRELTDFVKGGGTLILDAAGGSKEFAETAANELAYMFPSAARSRPNAPPGDFGDLLDKDADVFSITTAPIHAFGYRRYSVFKGIYGKTPRIRAFDIGTRHAVFFSPLDLSNGLLGRDTDGIIGYSPETATAVMRNLLLYAAGER